MSKIKLNIWGREFELNVSYQNFPDEEITENQDLTLQKLTSIDFSQSLSPVEQYIMKHNGYEIGENSISNIFRYLIPKSIVITRETEDRVFAVFCNYKFDIEHGLAIIYKNESYVDVGPEDKIL